MLLIKFTVRYKNLMKKLENQFKNKRGGTKKSRGGGVIETGLLAM